jgi:2-polyprenyl-3-methyl-5-hydroxy-6-metoxy-1,4-benzoquinol methylase
MQSSEPDVLFSGRVHYQGDRVSIIKKYFDKNKNFLEIGCSAGQFLSHVYQQFSNFSGIELDSHCAEYVRNKFNISVYEHELDKCDFKGNTFDYIAFFQVLEHVADPVKFLKFVHALLKENGKVFIEVPNLYDPLLVLWSVESYHQFYYHEAHSFYFSEKSLVKLLETAGFKVDECFFLQDYNILNHLYWFFNSGPQKTCDFGLSAPKIPFNPKYRDVGNTLNSLIDELNDKYKKLLSDNGITSNIFVVCSKK